MRRKKGKDMKTLKKFKDEQMKDSAFVKEYEEVRTEMEEVRVVVEGMTEEKCREDMK